MSFLAAPPQLPQRLKVAQKPYIVWSLGPKALQSMVFGPKSLKNMSPSSLRLRLGPGDFYKDSRSTLGLGGKRHEKV